MTSAFVSSEIDVLRDLYLFKEWLAKRSSSNYETGHGIINSSNLEQVNYMFSKKIKLFCNNNNEAYLVTKNGEYHSWLDFSKNIYKFPKNFEIFNDETDLMVLKMYQTIIYRVHILDWSNKRIKKCLVNNATFLVLTNNEEMYYLYHNSIQIAIYNKIEKITCLGCSYGFYVLVTDKNRTYSWSSSNRELSEKTELSDKTIVKVVCGDLHTLVLTDKGNVYAWGSNVCNQSDINSELRSVLSPTMVEIPTVKKISDIAAMKNLSLVKSSKDGLIYMWGRFANFKTNDIVNCEYTNIFDVCNVMMGQSPVSMDYVHTDEDTSILNDLEAIFNDSLTSDLTIKVKEKSIYVHKAILKIRSLYFRTMLQGNWKENSQRVTCCHHSYEVYVTYLKYLYTGMIDQSSIMDDLLDLLILANLYCEENLERDCIWMIKNKITASNVLFVHDMAVEYHKKELEEYCLEFFVKNMTIVMEEESFKKLNSDKKKTFITKVNNTYPYTVRFTKRI